MEKIFLVITLFMAVSNISKAAESGWSDDRIQIDLGVDDDGKMVPEVFIPFNWGDGWSSGFGLRSRQSDSNDSINGFPDSRVGTSVSEERLRLNLFAFEINNEKSNWSFGMDIEQVSLDQLQFGYFKMPDPYTANPAVAGEYVAFDSELAVDITKPNIFTDYTFIKNNLSVRVSLSLSPASSLSVDQETRFVPIVNTVGTRNSTTSQDVSYDFGFELDYKTNNNVSLRFGIYQELLPMKYEIAGLNSTANGFVDQTVDIEQATTRLAVKVIFNKPIYGKLKPVIGYITEDVETKNLNTDTNEEITKSIITFGLESRF